MNIGQVEREIFHPKMSSFKYAVNELKREYEQGQYL